MKIDRRKLLTGAAFVFAAPTAPAFAIGLLPDPTLPLCGERLPERVSFFAPPVHRAIPLDLLAKTLWAFDHDKYFVIADVEAVAHVEHAPTGIVFERVALDGDPYVLIPRAIKAGEPCPAPDDYRVIGHAALLRVIEAQRRWLTPLAVSRCA
jgi:hypothetical protein